MFITIKTMDGLKSMYGESDMLVCYSIAQGISATTDQAILLINEKKLLILYINKLTNNIVQKNEFLFSEFSKSSLKNCFFFSTVWKFNCCGQSLTFKIPFIYPLRTIRRDFIKCLYKMEIEGVLPIDLKK